MEGIDGWMTKEFIGGNGTLTLRKEICSPKERAKRWKERRVGRSGHSIRDSSLILEHPQNLLLQQIGKSTESLTCLLIKKVSLRPKIPSNFSFSLMYIILSGLYCTFFAVAGGCKLITLKKF